jgi:hypothetical protein
MAARSKVSSGIWPVVKAWSATTFGSGSMRASRVTVDGRVSLELAQQSPGKALGDLPRIETEMAAQ